MLIDIDHPVISLCSQWALPGLAARTLYHLPTEAGRETLVDEETMGLGRDLDFYIHQRKRSMNRVFSLRSGLVMLRG